MGGICLYFLVIIIAGVYFFNRWIIPSDAEVTFVQCTKSKKSYENHLNPVILVFIEKLLLRAVRWVPICQGFDHFSAFCHHDLLTELLTSSKRVNKIKSVLLLYHVRKTKLLFVFIINILTALDKINNIDGSSILWCTFDLKFSSYKIWNKFVKVIWNFM